VRFLGREQGASAGRFPLTLCALAYIRRNIFAVVLPRLLKERQMMKSNKSVAAALAAAVLIAGLCGCQKQEGPMERAGKQVDKAVDKAGQQIEKAGEKIQDTAKGTKK
jgi:hypothetical protein